MNKIILFIGIVVFLVLVFTITQILQKLYSKSSRKVCSVLAGDEREHQLRHSHADSLRPFESFRLNGKRIDPSKYILAKVEGECMHPRGIHSGNIVFIHKMTEEEKNDIKDGSILYIRSVKNGVESYLLREYVKDASCGDFVATRFYRNGYEPKDSDPHHKLDSVDGVVHYCFE